MFKYLYLLSAALVTVSHGMIISGEPKVDVGQCPNITNKYDFEAAPYLGVWYELERFPMSFEAGQDCVTATYSVLDDVYIKVYNRARLLKGPIVDITGRAHVIAPGVLLVEFFTMENSGAEYHVLDTDYEKFACVYNCVQTGPVRAQYAWLLSRTTDMDDETYNHAMGVFTDNGIDISLFQPTYQASDCPYLE
ncbi:apolipoprotein D-like [Palaemon carinicauda]|uniref:apolipoprotein D-like n=1 Tax=Palaemon carinicauda TaxID=392227 RepID=UPI0035B5B3CB